MCLGLSQKYPEGIKDLRDTSQLFCAIKATYASTQMNHQDTIQSISTQRIEVHVTQWFILENINMDSHV